MSKGNQEEYEPNSRKKDNSTGRTGRLDEYAYADGEFVRAKATGKTTRTIGFKVVATS